MSSRRTLIVAIVIVLVLLAALGTVALLLFGGEGGDDAAGSDVEPAAKTGIVWVRTIETYGEYRLTTPVGIGAGSDGGFFVTLRDQATVVEFDRDGDYIRHWGERGLEQGQMMVPLGVAVDRAGARVYVTDRSRLRLLCYDLEGTIRWEVPVLNPLTPAVTPTGVAVTTFGPLVQLDAEGAVVGEYGVRGELPGQFDYARGIAVLDEDTAIIADTNNARAQRVQFSGEVTATVDWVYGRPPLNQDDNTTVFGVPASVTLDEDGYAYVLDGFRAQVTVLDPDSGESVHRFDFATGIVDGQLYLPSAIAHLGDYTFAITDTANNRVQIFRLLRPGKNTALARTPWLGWLGALPALLLLLLFGRKRWFATAETLDRAAAEGRLRLLAAVLKRIHVLPEVYERYKDVEEEGVKLGGYLRAVEPPAHDSDTPEGAEEALAKAAEPTRLGRVLLRRHLVLCVDEPQCDRISQLKRRTRSFAELVARYVLDGERPVERQ